MKKKEIRVMEQSINYATGLGHIIPLEKGDKISIQSNVIELHSTGEIILLSESELRAIKCLGREVE